jgi:hypothetical protein
MEKKVFCKKKTQNTKISKLRIFYDFIHYDIELE